VVHLLLCPAIDASTELSGGSDNIDVGELGLEGERAGCGSLPPRRGVGWGGDEVCEASVDRAAVGVAQRGGGDGCAGLGRSGMRSRGRARCLAGS